ncbi:hypothetical protein GCM10009716_25450 [Streptomyces sodiiphilus]|uniref:ATP-grasp-modified RiPP n=1 Tax=Streptomyces sodiiphilus TaxID=226217 RepID=A0ABP5AJ59_9ACTN
MATLARKEHDAPSHRRLRGELSGSGVSYPAGRNVSPAPASPQAVPDSDARTGTYLGPPLLPAVVHDGLPGPAAGFGVSTLGARIGGQRDSRHTAPNDSRTMKITDTPLLDWNDHMSSQVKD